MISAGDLTQTISFISELAQQDSFGQPNAAGFVTVRTVRAKKVGLKVADIQRGSVNGAVAELKFQTRYYADVNTSLKLDYAGVRYDILSVDEDGNREGLFILCRVAR